MTLLTAYHNLDIERLSNIDIREFYPRGHGKTTAIAMHMLGEIQLGDDGNAYLYIGETTEATSFLRAYFIDILWHENIEVHSDIGRTTSIKANKKIISFASISNISQNYFRGIKFDDIYVDVTYDTQVLHRQHLLEIINFNQK